MEISPAPSVGAPAARSINLPREGSAVLSLQSGGYVSLSTHYPRQPSQDICVAPGGALLLAGGNTAVDIAVDGAHEDLAIEPVQAWVPRMLAFHDHANGRQRALLESPALPVCLPLPGPLDDAPRSRAWLIAQLAGVTPAFDRVAGLWARGEVYQLVRFVLSNTDMNVKELAARYGLSTAQFRRVSHKAFGRPLKEQLRLLRARRALQLHADTGASFTQLAGELGFSSPSHFCNEIKSLLGKSPRSIFQSTRLP